MLTGFFARVLTTPDFSRESQFELAPIPEAMPVRGYADLPASFTADAIVKQTEAGIIEHLEGIALDPAVLQDLQEAEKATKRRKGVLKFLEDVGRRQNLVPDAIAERRRHMMSVPEMGRIRAVIYTPCAPAAATKNSKKAVAAKLEPLQAKDDDNSERQLLTEFWSQLAAYMGDAGDEPAIYLLGYGLQSQTLLPLLCRSRMLGVRVPTSFELVSRGGPGLRHIDFQLLRFPSYPREQASLQTLAARYGLCRPTDVDPFWTTEQFAEKIDAGDTAGWTTQLNLEFSVEIALCRELRLLLAT